MKEFRLLRPDNLLGRKDILQVVKALKWGLRRRRKGGFGEVGEGRLE